MSACSDQLEREDQIKRVFEEVFRESSALEIGFEDAARYNRNFRLTLNRTVQDVHALGSCSRILELGAFTGVVAVTLARLGHQVTASDYPFALEDPAVSKFLSSNSIDLCPMDLAKIPFPQANEAFDVIVFHSILAHLNFNPLPLVQEFSRLLASGGRVYCATPNLLAAKNVARMVLRKGYLNPVQHLQWNLVPGSGMQVGLTWREWTKEELVDLFAAGGFELESHKFGVNTPNRSKFPRRHVVQAMYALCPSLMPTQIGIFRKR